MSGPTVKPGDITPPAPSGPPPSPLAAYRAALGKLGGARLRALAEKLAASSPSGPTDASVAGLTDYLGDPKVVARVVANLPAESRLALSLFALSETPAWPAQGLAHALGCLGVRFASATRPLLDVGLVAPEPEAAAFGPIGYPEVDRRLEGEEPEGVILRAHPAALAASRTVLPDGPPLPRAEAARGVREADGLEPILRMAALWQRVATAPLRQTQQGSFYKRDRERLEDDPALAGPIADALEPLPDMPALWLALARGVGLLEAEPGSERVTAAAPAFWSENAFHLAQMTAARWLAVWDWHEQGGAQQEGASVRLALPFARLPVLLWLATLGPDEWVAVDDMADHLRSLSPRWDRPAFRGDVDLSAEPGKAPARGRPPARGPKRKAAASPDEPDRSAALAAMVLGAAYQLGLVRTGEEVPSGRRLVQLAPTGRYLLALGPPPPPRQAFDQFLYVQPNFEVIAYRQGLTPLLIGRFSRFAEWSQVGAALALRLTPESVYQGLEGGMTPAAMQDLLQSHSPRPLPPGVAEALRTWSERRDRVTYHASATLLEFATPADLEAALAAWPATSQADGAPAPSRVTDRLLLVDGDSRIPFELFRQTGARDYRTPPDTCVEVEDDGVTLALDPARSDLLVDAELQRFSDPAPGVGSGLRRRYVVTSLSLARAAESGMTAGHLANWFERRTGGDTPPAVRLLLLAGSPQPPSLQAEQMLLVRTPTAEWLDGLDQHPETRDLVGERLGPTTAVIPPENLEPLRRALARLGLTLTTRGG